MGASGGRSALLLQNYPQLQNLIKRDAASYRDEFFQQYSHFKSTLVILQNGATLINNSSSTSCNTLVGLDNHFESLVMFISQVFDRYEESRHEFPQLLINWLERDALALSSTLRRTLVQCLLLVGRASLQKNNNNQATSLFSRLELFFKLLRVPDKLLRELLYESIVKEVRRANHPHRNNVLNRQLQNFMYRIFEESGKEAGTEERLATHKILQIIIELYQKKIWDDARTVNVIAEAATRPINSKVMVTALNFFAGRFRGHALVSSKGANDSEDEGGSDEEENGNNATEQYQNLLHSSKFSGNKKRSIQKKLRKTLNAVHRKEQKSNSIDKNGSFAAIHLLNDPQGFVERLFTKLKKSNELFAVKLLLMNIISRVIGAHKLILLDFYSFLLRYIQPHQQQVTQILAFTAQATHQHLSSDVIQPIVLAIMHNFAAEYCANEVIAAGLNGIREICMRCPEAMSDAMLADLSGTFKGYQDKGVVMATRSLISLYRKVNPELLHRRDRGKQLSIALKDGTFVKKTMSNGVYFDAKLAMTGAGEERMDAVDEEIRNDLDEENESIDSGEESETIDTDKESETIDEDEQEQDELSDSSDKRFDSDEDKDSEPDSALNDFIDQSDSDIDKESRKSSINDIVKLSSQKLFSTEEAALLRRRIVKSQSIHNDDNDEEGDSNLEEVIDPKALESQTKRKADYQARMASIKAGRQDRLKYGSKRGKHNEQSSVSNRIKQKRTKNAIMLAHKGSVRAKRKRSLREKQRSLIAHRRKQKIRR